MPWVDVGFEDLRVNQRIEVWNEDMSRLLDHFTIEDVTDEWAETPDGYIRREAVESGYFKIRVFINTYIDLLTPQVNTKVDISPHPGRCLHCGSPAYVGLHDTECLGDCEASKHGR